MMELDPEPSTSIVAPEISFPFNSSKISERSSAFTTGLADNPLSAYSPNFNFCALGNEAEKLKWLVLKHVEPSLLKKTFAPLMSNSKKNGINRTDELTCEQACSIMRVLELMPIDKSKPFTELEQACYGLIGLLNTEKKHLCELDQIITRIIISAAEQKIITLLLACQLLVSSIDFRMMTPPNPEKIQFVRKSMSQMDYKNMRDLVKLLLVEKLDKMPCQLTEKQHNDLYSIEKLVIDLIDRRNNYCPALFFITEISRIDTEHSSIHFLPRVSLKIREMVASFRPLAEIGCMLGRGWMWPVPASPIFSWSSQTWSAWKLDEKNCKLYFKTHLPYNSENSTAQSYLQYILLKQPHGQDNLNHILRSTATQTPLPRLHCDEVIQLLILEAMGAMEDSEQPVLAPINQYNWLHLSHLVTYALSMGHCTLSQLLIILLPELKNCQYLRAKEELIWILLQYIGYAKSKEKHTTQQHLTGMLLPMNGGLCQQTRELVLEIFNVLYTDKSMSWGGWGNTCSTEQPLNMVRFFAPAAIWINLVSCSFGSSAPNNTGGDQLPQPPEKLRKMIEFIENQISNKDQKQLDSSLLAVVANAYSNNAEIFDEHVNSAVFRLICGHQQQIIVNQIQPSQPQEKWTLPGGRKTDLPLLALDLEFLDSLTFHAKRQLYNYSLNQIFKLISLQQQTQQQAIWRLPSPALVESVARLLLSTELCDQNGQRFYYLALHTIKNLTPLQQHSTDLMAVFLELLNFRIPNIGFGWKCEFTNRTTFLQFILEHLISFNKIPGQSSMQNCLQMCQLLEQTVLRFAQCTWPQDMLNAIQQFNPSKWMKDVPELFRAFLLSALRAAKLLGDSGQVQSLCTELGWQWPIAELQWFPFPQNVQHTIGSYSEHQEQEEYKQMLDNVSTQEMEHLLALDANYFGQLQTPMHYDTTRQPPTLFISIFRCTCQFQLPMPAKPQHHTTTNFFVLCYKILSTLNNNDLLKLTNALIDWLAWKYDWLDGQQTMTAIKSEEYDLHRMILALNDMLFMRQFISVERLLFAITLHPSSDHSIRILLCILAALLDKKHSQLPERLRECYAFIPAHSHTSISNSESFFNKIVNYYKKYPEYSFVELYREQVQSEPSMDVLKLPIYYGNLAERICPIVDFLLQRALETEIKPTILDILLRNFSPIYRIHPLPMTFLYKTLYTLDNILLAQQQQFKQQDATSANINQALLSRPIRKFVLDIVVQLEPEESQQQMQSVGRGQSFLTLEFIQQDHQMPPIKFCRVLIERIVHASTYTHQPPSFVHRDWRFAEFSPAAQCLTSAWVELLASRHSPADIVNALIQLAVHRPIPRPADTLNALGLLLTGLPASFQSIFLDQIEHSFDWAQIALPNADPTQLFESLSHEVYLQSSSQILSMLALIHSYCQHGGNNSLYIIPELIVQRLAPKVQNEAQLLYFLRIVVPYLQRIHEKERNRHMTEIVAIYEVLGKLTQKLGRLQYEDTICDLLYQFKYMFVGYQLKEQTEQHIRSFPESMREKLKFLLTHSSSSATMTAENQQQQMQQMLQQHMQNQTSQVHTGIKQNNSLPTATTLSQQQQQMGAFNLFQYNQQFKMPMSGVQQPLPFVPPSLQFDMANQPALHSMLRRQSTESGNDPMSACPSTNQITSEIVQFSQQQGAQVNRTFNVQQSNQAASFSSQIDNTQMNTGNFGFNQSAPGFGLGGQQLAPPPPYQVAIGGTQQQISTTQIPNFPSLIAGQILPVGLPTTGAQIATPVQYQQMMVAKQQVAATPNGQTMQPLTHCISATTNNTNSVSGGAFASGTTHQAQLTHTAQMDI